MHFDEVICFSSVPTALSLYESRAGPGVTDASGGATCSRPRTSSATSAMSLSFLMLWMAIVSSPFMSSGDLLPSPMAWSISVSDESSSSAAKQGDGVGSGDRA
ncbi:hypothetical protein GUJ93_ZPchr0014g47391 [Zizania palustris]|uniref:Uncharacterized protein n=1 Tax=Zizania palustris TaxID=103762 RepID=A0A8J5SWV5_ZIZPA|nr:hypothetical protein GUJ93_ZPchr0014g47391 [Zizania palustris]